MGESIKTMQAGSWQAAKPRLNGREIPCGRVASAGRVLVRLDADEPTDSMMARISREIDQNSLSADESI